MGRRSLDISSSSERRTRRAAASERRSHAEVSVAKPRLTKDCADVCVRSSSYFLARSVRVRTAGVDTWSLCWYAEPRSTLRSALRSMATQSADRAQIVPEKVGNHRVGWFPDSGLVFIEGSLGAAGDLCPAADVLHRASDVVEEVKSYGIPLEAVSTAAVRRLDVAVDLCTDSSADGLALLECLAGVSFLSKKTVTYRMDHAVQTVTIKSRVGRSQARIYDKGVQTGAEPRGRWIRFEAQWRFDKGHRLAPEDLTGDLLRERFLQRFDGLYESTSSFEVGGANAIAARLAEGVAVGDLKPSRARSIAGYLLLSSVGSPQGGSRTVYTLERECRELGLSLALLDPMASVKVDVSDVLGKCLMPEVW